MTHKGGRLLSTLVCFLFSYLTLTESLLLCPLMNKSTLELANQAVATINLKGRKIFLFGTAGFGGSAAYFQKILDHIKQSVDPSNTVVGEYMCQGKMPQSVRDRYMKMKAQPEHPANIDALIDNFDRALSHPDEDDLERLRKIILG